MATEEIAENEEIDQPQDLPELPVGDGEEKTETNKIDMQADYSHVQQCIVRQNGRHIVVDPERLKEKEFKTTYVSIDNGIAIVDMDKHKIRPFLLSILGQYEILPELKKLNMIENLAFGVVGLQIVSLLFVPKYGDEFKKVNESLATITEKAQKANGSYVPQAFKPVDTNTGATRKLEK